MGRRGWIRESSRRDGFYFVPDAHRQVDSIEFGGRLDAGHLGGEISRIMLRFPAWLLGRWFYLGHFFQREEEAQAWCSPFYSEFCSNVRSLERPPLFMLSKRIFPLSVVQPSYQ